jgi:hypothetical protein
LAIEKKTAEKTAKNSKTAKKQRKFKKQIQKQRKNSEKIFEACAENVRVKA